LANGIRHLFWDTGRGFAKSAARRSARMVIAFVVVAGALLVYVFFCPVGGVQ
jgi:succinate dehydrogenase/fumarate reductase cytochrome b subunit